MERRFATVPFISRPVANVDERLRRIISVAKLQFEQKLEHARFNNSMQRFAGFRDFVVCTSPSRELAQLPAAPAADLREDAGSHFPSS